MDENLGKFIDDFARLVQLAQSGQHRIQAGTELLTTLGPLGGSRRIIVRGGGGDTAAPVRGC